MIIEIRDFNHARQLVAEGDITHADVRDSHSAIMLRDAFEERFNALGDCTTTAAIDEAKWIADELDALDSDWMDPPSPECEWHLY